MINKLIKYFSLAAILCITINLSAQNNSNIYLTQHNDGIFIKFSNQVNNNFTTYIERQFNNGHWDSLAQVVKPKTLEAFQNNLTYFSYYFQDYPLPSKEEIRKLWDKIEKYGLLDSLAYWAGTPTVILALGAAYIDTAVTTGAYNYKITTKDESGKIVFSASSKQIQFPVPANIGKIKFLSNNSGKNYIFSQWFAKQPYPNQVRIFREDVNIGKFELINTIKGFSKRNDSLFIFIKDTTVNKGSQYNYYLEPVNLFEVKGGNSDTIKMANWDINSLVLEEFTLKNIDSLSSIKLFYKISDPQLVSNVKIFRSLSADSGYSLIAEISPSTQEYIDFNAIPMQNYYYALKFDDYYGNETGLSVKGFAFYLSQEVPFPPNFLSIEGTNNGILLKWTNLEKNIDGFYIYRNDGSLPQLEIIAPMLKLKEDSIYTFLDSTNTLKGNKFYSYSLRSESTSHVKSSFSDTLTARPLFPTKPPSPMNVSLSVIENGFRLNWADLTQISEDIMGYNVYRKDKNIKMEFVNVSDSILDINHNYFIDSTILLDKEYEYAVTSKDIFGGESSLAGLLTGIKESSMPPPPSEIKLYPQENNVILRWDPVLSNFSEYLIFRYERGNNPVQIGSIKQSEDPEFIDSKVIKGRLYFYFIKTKNDNGKESLPSPESSLRFE